MGRFGVKGVKIKESEALIFMIAVSLFIIALVFTVLNSKVKQVKSRINTLNEEYRKALVLYEKIKKQSGRKAIFHGNILLLVQALQRDRKMKEKIFSVSTTDDGNAIILKLRHLNLSELLKVFKSLEGYKNIEIKHLVLRKSFTSNKLLDLDLTVVKTE